jgi:hypothetical protein
MQEIARQSEGGTTLGQERFADADGLGIMEEPSRRLAGEDARRRNHRLMALGRSVLIEEKGVIRKRRCGCG